MYADVGYRIRSRPCPISDGGDQRLDSNHASTIEHPKSRSSTGIGHGSDSATLSRHEYPHLPRPDLGPLGVLLSSAAFGLWAERTGSARSFRVRWSRSGPTFVLSNLRVIPAESPAYGAVWSYLVPLAIPLLLFKADLRRIIREAGPTLIAFAAGAVGTVAGTWIAFQLVPLGPEGWKLAGIFCATYVGGSLNYMAAAEALGLRSGDVLAAGVAADNLAMALYFLVLFALPSLPWLRRKYARRVGEVAARRLPEFRAAFGSRRRHGDGSGRCGHGLCDRLRHRRGHRNELERYSFCYRLDRDPRDCRARPSRFDRRRTRDRRI